MLVWVEHKQEHDQWHKTYKHQDVDGHRCQCSQGLSWKCAFSRLLLARLTWPNSDHYSTLGARLVMSTGLAIKMNNFELYAGIETSSLLASAPAISTLSSAKNVSKLDHISNPRAQSVPPRVLGSTWAISIIGSDTYEHDQGQSSSLQDQVPPREFIETRTNRVKW